MPSIAEICRAAGLDRNTFDSLTRSGRIDHWPHGKSKEFAVLVGLYAALRAAGLLNPTAVYVADDLAKSPPALFCLAPFEGKEGRELRDYSGALRDKTISEVATMLADDKGRWVIGDGPPDPILDAEPQAAVFSVINVPFIVRTMEELFE